MAGYSKRTLTEKLGISSKGRSASGRREGMSVLVLHSPKPYNDFVPNTLFVSSMTSSDFFDIIHIFSKSREELEQAFPKLKSHLKPTGSLWVSWPKQTRHSRESGNLQTNLNENIVMKIGLAHGLVDVKVIAVDEVWSGLKFVYRLKDRK